ncbi:hypothetical protein GOBAR_AA16627 [Gossypium barbadense]|uniref:Uncharacterized protein n=1 Tax=Gossypium barbadense TaxID=3634 RepID=A0A2P5XL16_GOSBA|nr:hypothetical protein GOBAR_AA16627 [Gossypium barbadense]
MATFLLLFISILTILGVVQETNSTVTVVDRRSHQPGGDIWAILGKETNHDKSSFLHGDTILRIRMRCCLHRLVSHQWQAQCQRIPRPYFGTLANKVRGALGTLSHHPNYCNLY